MKIPIYSPLKQKCQVKRPPLYISHKGLGLKLYSGLRFWRRPQGLQLAYFGWAWWHWYRVFIHSGSPNN